MDLGQAGEAVQLHYQQNKKRLVEHLPVIVRKATGVCGWGFCDVFGGFFQYFKDLCQASKLSAGFRIYIMWL